MRANMFSVIVERPRRGGLPDGARVSRNLQEVPRKIGMRRGYFARKCLNENLVPLQHFLEGQAGVRGTASTAKSAKPSTGAAR